MKKFQNLPSIFVIVFSIILAFGLVGCDTDIVDSHQKTQASNLILQL